jgi:Sec23-binding domain of Sec16
VQELIPPKAMPAAKDSLLAAPAGLHTTPVSPNFPHTALTSSVPPESLAKWQETAAVMAFSQTTGDSAALTALGDYLAANRWFEAAHAWFACFFSILAVYSHSLFLQLPFISADILPRRGWNTICSYRSCGL